MADKTQPSLNKFSPNKFVLILTIPEVLKTLNTRKLRSNKTFNLDALQFSLRNINIPQSNVPAHPLHIYGQNYNITSHDRPAYDPLRLDFEVDNEFKNYWVIWQWQQLLAHNLDAMYASPNILPDGVPDEITPDQYHYVTDLIVFGLDEYNNRKVKFTFKYAFPTAVGELQYDYRNTEELTCNAVFVFNQLDIELLCGINGINCDE
jgi:hypothetical protein